MNNHIAKEWTETTEKTALHGFVQKYPLDDRTTRLFAIACCREVWDQITSERLRKAVEIAELYVDGLATEDELQKARSGIIFEFSATFGWAAVLHAVSKNATAPYFAAIYASEERTRQSLILAQMYPTTFNEQWINPTTTSLAHNIYNNKDFSLMPILADALQDVDCNEDILNHLRSKGPFYKGNYIIDKLIGKRS